MCIEKLQSLAFAEVKRVLGDERRVVLLDIPDHPNVGDNAIWLGTLALLRRAGVALMPYTCAADTFDPVQLATIPKTMPVLLHGGGNFGDIYGRHQAFRHEVLTALPDHHIVQMPQSIHFSSDAEREASARLFRRHGRVTILVRDEVSARVARESFSDDVRLCPDLAFGLGPLSRRGMATMDVLALARRDSEGGVSRAAGASDDVEFVDWGDTRGGGWHALWGFVRDHPRVGTLVANRRHAFFERVARQRLEMGLRLLSRGRAVVTDRLHGHILSVLLGIPNVVVDNAYGKNSRFIRMWTTHCPHVSEAATFGSGYAEALRKASGASRPLDAPGAEG